MLAESLLNELAEYTASKIVSAEIVIDEEIRDVKIMRKDVIGNLVKVYVNTTSGKGTITDIRLKDDKGNTLVSKPGNRIKNIGYALVSSFYIKFIEDEITDPKTIFDEMRKDNNYGQ